MCRVEFEGSDIRVPVSDARARQGTFAAEEDFVLWLEVRETVSTAVRATEFDARPDGKSGGLRPS